MTAIDNEATTIIDRTEESTQIVDRNVPEEKEIEKTVDDDTAQASEEVKNRHKTAKTLGGIAAGGSILGSAAAALMDSEDLSEEVYPEDKPEPETITMAAEMVELPELVVEALSTKHEGDANVSTSTEMHDVEAVSTTEPIYAEVADPKPEKTDQTPDVPTEPAASINNPLTQEDAYGADIPIVSVGGAEDSESDIQILGVTQDISTGYNVGHLTVDGEEVVVIDVDGDMIFDSVVADLNHDGDITPDEIIDIRGNSFTLDNISGLTDVFNDPLTGEEPDYLSETVN